MTSLSSRPTDTPVGTDPTPTQWRIAGGLALAHVVLLFAGFSQEVAADHSTSAAGIRDLYGSADLTRVMAGGYVESLSYIVLIPAIVFAAWALGRRTPLARWAAVSGLVAGIGYVVSTLAVGMPAGAAALFGLQHGGDAQTALMVNDIRNYAFHLQVLLAAGLALGLGVAALSSRLFPRWVGWGGIVTGVVGIVGGAVAQNVGSMTWIVWMVGLGVCFLRTPHHE